jgi:hypothetical protein
VPSTDRPANASCGDVPISPGQRNTAHIIVQNARKRVGGTFFHSLNRGRHTPLIPQNTPIRNIGPTMLTLMALALSANDERITRVLCATNTISHLNLYPAV